MRMTVSTRWLHLPAWRRRVVAPAMRWLAIQLAFAAALRESLHAARRPISLQREQAVEDQ
jgi:hypothetical protein